MAKMNSRVDFIENKIHIIEEKISIFEDKLKMMMDMFSLMKQNIDTLHTAVQHSSSQTTKHKIPSNFYRRSYHGEPLSPSDSEIDSPMPKATQTMNQLESPRIPPAPINDIRYQPQVQIIKSEIPRSRCAI